VGAAAAEGREAVPASRDGRDGRNAAAPVRSGRSAQGKPRPSRSGGKARTPFRPPQKPGRHAAGSGQRGGGAPAAGGFRRALAGDDWPDEGAGYPPAFVPPDFDRPERVPMGPTQKLQKVLADAGVGSRRAMETLIGRGAVTVNGRPATIGTRVATGDGTYPGDVIAIDGRRIRARAGEAPKVLLYHKPEGEIVSHDDPAGRASVFDALPRLRNGKWLSVGRLDFNTSGLLIFTDSGDFANALMHPRFGNEREYAVRVLGALTPEQLGQLTAGIELADGLARFESIHDGGGDGANRWYRVVVTEGRNRLVRRLFEASRLTVSRLMRVRFGPIELPSKLKRGQFLSLTDEEVGAIQARMERDADNQAAMPASAARTQDRPRARPGDDNLPRLAVPEGRPGRKRLDRRVPRTATPRPAGGSGERPRAPGRSDAPGRRSEPPASRGTGSRGTAGSVRPRSGVAARSGSAGRSAAEGRSGSAGRPSGGRPASATRSGASGRPGKAATRGPRAPAGRPKTPGRSSRST
jgi:23S rRNA pseudouridine2605 synthase